MSAAHDVLIVEADELQRQLIDMLLSDARLRLVERTSARDALEYLRSATPALAVIAADLPDLDGFALTSRLKRVVRLANVPVIVTAEPDAGSGVSRELRQQAEECNADLLLPRPLGDKNLKERALRLIASGGRSLDRQLHSTSALDDALEVLPARGGAHPGAHAAAASSQSSPRGPHRTLDAEALERENYALRRENHELRATIERLKRQLPGGRNRPN